jgi:acyl-CoA thioester hydrolase
VTARRERVAAVGDGGPAAYPFTETVRVRFSETDAMGVAHHGSYLLYLEVGRVAFLRASGHPYDRLREEGIDLPLTELAVRYVGPLHFDDLVDVHLRVGAVSRATMRLDYRLAVGSQTRALAASVHAAVRPDGRAVRMPEWVHGLATR